jgi:hypothetical protein
MNSIKSSRGRAATVALILCLAGIAIVVPGGMTAQTVSVWVEPAETRIAPGEICTLYVHVDDGVDSLSCAWCSLGFDSTVVSCVSASKGELYDEASFPTFFDPDVPSADTISLTACVLGYRSYIIPPGSLFEIRFEALAPGQTYVEIGTVSVFDIDRYGLEEDIGQRGMIIVTTQTGGTVPTPEGGRLSNYPNPFNPATTIVLELPTDSDFGHTTEVDIYDPAGRRVRRLFSGIAVPGQNEFYWDGTSGSGSAVSSGLYMAVSRTGSLRLERKLVLIR